MPPLDCAEPSRAPVPSLKACLKIQMMRRTASSCDSSRWHRVHLQFQKQSLHVYKKALRVTSDSSVLASLRRLLPRSPWLAHPDACKMQDFCTHKSVTLFIDLMKVMETFSQLRDRNLEAENQVTFFKLEVFCRHSFSDGHEALQNTGSYF